MTQTHQPTTTAQSRRNIMLFGMMALPLCFVGFVQSWNVTFSLLNMCLISAIMALGLNIQWVMPGCSMSASWVLPRLAGWQVFWYRRHRSPQPGRLVVLVLSVV